MLMNVYAALAQQVTVQGRFYADSLKIGEPVPFALTARYPREVNLIFPDSSYNFGIFEYHRKKYFPTETKGGLSYDSVVYYLSSYEIDSVQSLQLPVFVIHPSDCTEVLSIPDSIFLKHLVESVPDSVAVPQLPLKAQTSYLNVKWLFNYPLWAIIGGALLLLALVGWIVFGKRIRKHFRIKKLKRLHENFVNSFNEAVSQLAKNYATTKAEQTLVLWKQYMELLEGRPFTKYTSKEILMHESDHTLGSSLQSIDRSIYAGVPGDTIVFERLRDFSESKFNQKLEAVRHE